MFEELLRKGLLEELEKLKDKDIKKIVKKEVKKAKREAKKEAFEQAQIEQQEIKAQWITKMIKNGMEEQEILEITEISKEELEEIKNKMEKKAS